MRLLERERELARLAELVEGASAGEPAFLLVTGPAGAGKSSILGALASSADARGLRVLRAVGVELERDYPFGVVRQLFEPAIHDLDEETRGELFAGAAALAEPLLIGGGTESGQLDDSGFALMHSLYWLLVGLTDLGPLALVVDDIQWADSASLRFLGFVHKRSEELPLLVAVAKRDLPPAEQSDALAAVLGGPAVVLRPAPLSRTAVGSLLATAVGGELDDEIVAEAVRLTEGNPLYINELADGLRAVADDSMRSQLETLERAAPAAVGRRVETALARVSRSAQSVATAAAIFGAEAPLRWAAALAGIEYEHASAAADELVRVNILAAGEPLRFRHPLVHEAVLESIGSRELAAIHGRAAQLLTAEGEPPEHAAVHLLESDPLGDPDTVAVLREAAQRAVGQSAPRLAISALRRAIREPPEPATRPLVLKELGMIEAQIGDQQANGHLEAAFATASSLADMADAAVRYAMIVASQGNPVEAEALVDRVLASIDDRERRLMLEAELYTLAMHFDTPGQRERLVRVAAELRGESPGERLLLGLNADRAVSVGEMAAADAIPLVGAALGDGFLLAELGPDSPTYLELIAALQWMDEAERLEAELSAAVAEARRHGASFGLAIALTSRTALAWNRGQLSRAEADARTAVEVAMQMGWAAAFPVALTWLVEVLIDEGELHEADRLIEVNDLTGPVPSNRAGTELLGARGRLRLSQGLSERGIADLEEQKKRLDEAGESPPFVSARLAAALVPALMQASREEQAQQMAEEALRAARVLGQPRYIAHGLRACALAQPGGANLDGLSEAAAIYEHVGAALDLARTLVDIGAALRRQRRLAAARDPLRRALDLARACGARPLAERAEHELRASGARPRRDRITGRDALTATEQRVAELAVEGMTNRQIAEALFVTRKTVKSHLEHIYRKLGIHGRNELHRALAVEDELAAAG